MLILTMVTVPSIRRYYGIFFLVFSLVILPQVMRASSVMGHFALSTRMSWHTAFQALGHFPNQYGLEDEDLYVFTKTEKDYGVQYNYCDYTKQDAAAKKEFMAIWDRDPGFVVRSMTARVTQSILFNYGSDSEAKDMDGLILTLIGFFTLLFVLRRRGEHLFITGIMALIYLGYSTAIGLVYFAAMPYAYVTQLALLFMLPSFTVAAIAIGGDVMDHPTKLGRANYWRLDPKAPIARMVFKILVVGAVVAGVALCVPAVRDYVFPTRPYQDNLVIYGPPNISDNQNLMHLWEGLPEKPKKAFLDMVYKAVPKTDNASYDVSHYIADNVRAVLYRVYADNSGPKIVFGTGLYTVDALQAVNAVSHSILGWQNQSIEMFAMNDPESWDGTKIRIHLVPTPERVGVDYQRIATDKFARFNYVVTWLGPNELIARHNGHRCDALRTVLGIFYRGYCPYDATLAPSPLAPKTAPKSLTPVDKNGS